MDRGEDRWDDGAVLRALFTIFTFFTFFTLTVFAVFFDFFGFLCFFFTVTVIHGVRRDVKKNNYSAMISIFSPFIAINRPFTASLRLCFSTISRPTFSRSHLCSSPP